MKHSLIFLLSCLPALLFAQSPWACNKAVCYVQAAYYFIPSYTTLFGENGEDIVLERAVSEKQIQLYGEYGISKKSTLILSLPVVFNARGASNPSSPYMFEQEDSGRIAGIHSFPTRRSSDLIGRGTL